MLAGTALALDRRPYTAVEVSELPESPFACHLRKANILAGPRYRLQVKLTQATPLFLTLQLNQLLRYAKIHYDIHASNVITQKCRCLHKSRESWSRGTNAFKVIL